MQYAHETKGDANMTKPPRIEKTQGQTDKRIEKLSSRAFEKEFGFKPNDKAEQRYFATYGERPESKEADE